jgi:hypothetical protein
MAGTFPPPTQTIQVIAPGTYGPGVRTFAARTFPDNIRAAEVLIDVSQRAVSIGVSATLQISYDGGTSWLTYTATIDEGQQTFPGGLLSIAIGKGNGIPMVAGRMVQGQVSVTNGSLTTSGMNVNLWQ